MAKRHRNSEEGHDEPFGQPHGEEERHPFVLNRDLAVAGQSHKKGEEVMLTKEEYDVLAPMGVLEGGEPKSAEQVQEEHEAAVEAQKERIEGGPPLPEGEEPKEETDEEKLERIKREQSNPNAGLMPPNPVPHRSA